MIAIKRGDVWWADLGKPQGSEPGFRRPVILVQADSANKSLLNTVIVVTLTFNIRLADAPGNVLFSAKEIGLKKASVANVSQVATIDKEWLVEHIKKLSEKNMRRVDAGLKLILGFGEDF